MKVLYPQNLGYKGYNPPKKMKEMWVPTGGFLPTEPARLGLAAWCPESQATHGAVPRHGDWLVQGHRGKQNLECTW